jgi:hypothetical protein
VSTKKEVLIICPGTWEVLQLPGCRARWEDRYEVITLGEGIEDHVEGFDALAFLDEIVARFRGTPLAGVTSSGDYPGCLLAAAAARELGLPGAPLQAVFTCSHKYYARLAQQRVAPELTPRFALIDPDHLRPEALAIQPPFFVKPVKSSFSVLAERVNTLAELADMVARPEVRAHLRVFAKPFNDLLDRYGGFEHNASYLLAEELLAGQQVTVEGFAYGGEVQIIGITDSIMFPGTISFQRFEAPSSLPPTVQDRMEALAVRVMQGVGFEHGLFNIEMFYDPATDGVHVIEINPRMCGQFADLMELVNGTNTYEILLALAVGERPRFQRGAGRCRVAASFPLRAFADRRVARVPSAEDVAEVKRQFAVTLVYAPYAVGERLSHLAAETSDGASYRYAVLNMGGADGASLLADFAAVERRLGFELADPGE